MTEEERTRRRQAAVEKRIAQQQQQQAVRARLEKVLRDNCVAVVTNAPTRRSSTAWWSCTTWAFGTA